MRREGSPAGPGGGLEVEVRGWREEGSAWVQHGEEMRHGERRGDGVKSDTAPLAASKSTDLNRLERLLGPRGCGHSRPPASVAAAAAVRPHCRSHHLREVLPVRWDPTKREARPGERLTGQMRASVAAAAAAAGSFSTGC